MGEMRRCSRCEEIKPIEEFSWKDRAKGYRQAWCKTCMAAYCKRLREADPDKEIARQKRYNEAHRREKAAYSKRYDKANPGRAREKVRRRRALRNGAEGSHTDAEFMALVEACAWVCLECGERMTMPERGRIDGSKPTDLTRDHIVPLSKGGTDWISNIGPMCRGCNSGKHDRLVVEAYQCAA